MLWVGQEQTCLHVSSRKALGSCSLCHKDLHGTSSQLGFRFSLPPLQFFETDALMSSGSDHKWHSWAHFSTCCVTRKEVEHSTGFLAACIPKDRHISSTFHSAKTQERHRKLCMEGRKQPRDSTGVWGLSWMGTSAPKRKTNKQKTLLQ